VVKLYVVKKCVFLVVFGANRVGGRPGWAVRREIGYRVPPEPKPFLVSFLNNEVTEQLLFGMGADVAARGIGTGKLLFIKVIVNPTTSV
jgi:hypothetical protein